VRDHNRDLSTAISTVLADWVAAETKADVEQLTAILDDEFVAVGPLGFTLSKQDWLDRHASGALRYESVELADVRERHFGDVVVVIARQQSPGAYQGNAVPSTLRVTLVLVRRAATWRLASAHLSFVAGTPGAPPIPGRS
jgi:ketosteroid isomerase-like protein